MIAIRAITNLLLNAATVALLATTTFLILLALHVLGVHLRIHPVEQTLGVACVTAWRLYRGSTPLEEIRRFLNLEWPNENTGLRSNNPWKGTANGDRSGTPGQPLNFTIRASPRRRR